MRYDQAHYMWALRQLSEVSGWGIHASSVLSSEFITIAEDACKGIRPTEDALNGEVFSYNSRWNCFIRVGVTFCASIENDRTNYLCHLLVPEEKQIQSADELFFENIYAGEESQVMQLEKLSVETKRDSSQYHTVLRKYGLMDCENADRKLAKLIYLFYQSALRGAQDNRIILGSFSENYMETTHDIMWLMHSWAGDETGLRKWLTYRVYASCSGTAINFTSAGNENDLILDEAYEHPIGNNQPEEKMFLQLAESAQKSPGELLERIRILQKLYRSSGVDELAYACIQMLMKHYNVKLDGELLSFVRKRSVGQNRIAESYRRLYLTYESQREDVISPKQADMDWKILCNSSNAADLMSKYQDFILVLLGTFQAADNYEYARKMLLRIRSVNESVFKKLLDQLCQGDSADWIMTWHVDAVRILQMHQRMQYLQLIFQLYDPVADKILSDPLVVDKLMIISEVYCSGENQKTISEYVLENLCPKVSENQLLHDKWYEFIEENTKKLINEKSLRYCIEHKGEMDPYALYPVCDMALKELEDIYIRNDEPENWQRLDQIVSVIECTKLLAPLRRDAIAEQIKAVRQAEREKKKYMIRRLIEEADTVEAVVEIEKQIPTQYPGLWSHWCQKLYECLKNKRLKNRSENHIRDKIREFYEKIDFFKSSYFENSLSCIVLMQDAVRLAGSWFQPNSIFLDMSRIEKIAAYAWFCTDAASPEHGLMTTEEAKDFFWDMIQEKDFSEMYSKEICFDSNVKKLCESNHKTRRLYSFYMCYYTGDLRNSDELRDFDYEKDVYKTLVNIIYREEESAAEKRNGNPDPRQLSNFLILQKLREETGGADESLMHQTFYKKACNDSGIQNWLMEGRGLVEPRLLVMWKRLKACSLINKSIISLSGINEEALSTVFIPEDLDMKMIAGLVSEDRILSSYLKEQFQTIGLKLRDLKECYNINMKNEKSKAELLKSKIRELSINKKRKQTDISAWKADIEENDQRIRELDEETSELNKEAEALEKQLNDLRRRIGTLTQDKKKLCEANDSLKGNLAISNRELEGIEDSIQIEQRELNANLSRQNEYEEMQRVLERSEQKVHDVLHGHSEQIPDIYSDKNQTEETSELMAEKSWSAALQSDADDINDSELFVISEEPSVILPPMVNPENEAVEEKASDKKKGPMNIDCFLE